MSTIKNERKMLKAARKLEKATTQYLAKLVKIDESFQSLPTSLTRSYCLEENYFKNIEKILRSTVGLEVLAAKLEGQMNFGNECPL